MSTVKATNLQHASSATPNLVLAADGSVSGGLPYPNRNLLHNGAMQVHQRGTSVAGITAAGYNTADRWNLAANALATWTQSVENDAPTGSGFRKSLKMLCTTADASPAASDFMLLVQALEGQDVQRIAKGTASAQQLTLSFWAKANVTGTYIVGLFDADNTRIVSASYTISASATWERKTVTFPTDTTGAFDNDSAGSLYIQWWLGAGTNYTSGTLNTVWSYANNADRVVGQVNVAAATNNYWQITGVQLEVGPVATPFEFKSYGQELQECQRYYQRLGGVGSAAFGSGLAVATTTAFFHIPFLLTMRASPLLSITGTLKVSDSSTYDADTTVIAGQNTAPHSARASFTTAGVTAYRPALLFASSANDYLNVSADL